MELHKIQVCPRLFKKLCDLERYGRSKGLNDRQQQAKCNPNR